MKALIVNYGTGNIYSISASLKRVGFDVEVSDIPRNDVDLLVLPGVGSSKALKSYLDRERGRLKDIIMSGVHTLGICLGMQILFEYSYEYGYMEGLGIFKGYIDVIKTRRKVPHIGWDRVYVFSRGGVCSLFEEVDKEHVYFMHSYVAYPDDASCVCMVSLYDSIFPAAVAWRNVVGTQFHPEKSGLAGRKFLKVVTEWIRK